MVILYSFPWDWYLAACLWGMALSTVDCSLLLFFIRFVIVGFFHFLFNRRISCAVSFQCFGVLRFQYYSDEISVFMIVDAFFGAIESVLGIWSWTVIVNCNYGGILSWKFNRNLCSHFQNTLWNWNEWIYVQIERAQPLKIAHNKKEMKITLCIYVFT